MKALILLITGGAAGFLACFFWKSAPGMERWRENRAHFWSRGGVDAAASREGVLSGMSAPVFTDGEDDARRVLVRAYAVAPGQTRVVVTQWRPEKSPAAELAKSEGAGAKSVSREGETRSLRMTRAGTAWVLSVDIYRVDGDGAALTGDDFVNLPQRVYFDDTLYRGLPVQPAPQD